MEYKLNDYLALKLEENKTKIYIDNKEFGLYCKLAILTIDLNKIKEYDEIESIDEAVKIYNSNEKKELNPSDLKIAPEQEFWAHCSNLQVWVENKYNLDSETFCFQLFELVKNLFDAVIGKSNFAGI